MKRRDPEQLNKRVPAASEEPEYALEDILREFGSAPETAKPLSGDTVAFRPVLGKVKDPRLDEPMKVAGPAGSAPTLYHEEPVQSDPPPEPKPQEPPPVKKKKATQAEKAAKQQAPEPAPKPPKPPKPSKPPKIRPAPPVPTPAGSFQALQRTMGPALLRLWLTAAAVLLSIFLLLCDGLDWQLPALSPGLRTGLAVGLLSLCLALAFEVPLDGLRELLHLRPSHTTLGTLAAGLAIADAVMNGQSAYCAVAATLIFCLFRGLFQERSARFHTLKTVCAIEQPVGIYTVPQLLKQSDSLRRGDASTEDFMLHLGMTDLPRRVMRVYGTVLLLSTPVAAWFLAGPSGISFLRCWLLLLLGGIPFSCGLCYSQPFATLAKRLRRMGGALCGWHSARIFRGQHTLVLRDEDIFPRKHIVSSGMKLYGSHPPALVIGYALAALQAAESPLSDLFAGLLQAQYGRRYTADSYRSYNAGGLGAEVNGDVVLVGSLSFMRSMGVHMPDGTRVRQAVYVSVGGELAGIFALKYKPSASTRAGLLQLASKESIRVVLATRDFLIPPELIAARYELPTDDLVFPGYDERLRLSATEPGQPMEQAALISADTFGAFASAVAAGRMLRGAAVLALWLCLLAGIFGLALCALLLLWGSAATASPLNLGVFHLLWSILTSFVTFVMLRP